MFYKLIYRRSLQKYRKSYFNILCIFILSLSMLSFTNIYCDSYYNYDDAVLVPLLTADHTCDIRVKNITEKEAELFADVPNVDMEYINGNLDFYLIDTSLGEETQRHIVKIFNRYIFDDTYSDISPAINVFYGYEPKVETDYGVRVGTIVFQTVLSAIGMISMVLIYSDYINQRALDIRTLSGIGITERQLNRLFFRECNVLYFLSVVIGIPLGGIIAYLFFKMCEVVDMSHSTAIYPVFNLEIGSLVFTALAGYLVIYITFRIVLRKILRIDAAYTCSESVTEFDPDKTRYLYNKADRNFDVFFASVLHKRSSSGFKFLSALVMFIIAISIFMINTISYEANMGTLVDEFDETVVAETIANSSLFVMTIIYALLYSLTIVCIFSKRQMESVSKMVQILYILGADEYITYSCFHRYTMRKVITSELFGFLIGYGFTLLVFGAFGYSLNVNVWFILANIVLAVAHYLVYMLSMRKYFYENCRSTVSEEEGGTYVAS